MNKQDRKTIISQMLSTEKVIKEAFAPDVKEGETYADVLFKQFLDEIVIEGLDD